MVTIAAAIERLSVNFGKPSATGEGGRATFPLGLSDGKASMFHMPMRCEQLVERCEVAAYQGGRILAHYKDRQVLLEIALHRGAPSGRWKARSTIKGPRAPRRGVK